MMTDLHPKLVILLHVGLNVHDTKQELRIREQEATLCTLVSMSGMEEVIQRLQNVINPEVLSILLERRVKQMV